jgi:23S rRNA pseudouridine1911/1915/1917 synthase
VVERLPAAMPTILVSSEASGQRADVYIARALPDLSRSRVQMLLREGWILVNAAPVRPSGRVRGGDCITVELPAPLPVDTLPEKIPLHILYEDGDLLVVNKASGMVVHPAAGNEQGTLVNALLHHCQDLSGIGGTRRPGIVHRLDKGTSGCLVVAKHDPVHRALAKQFAARHVTKIYLALAAGHFRSKRGIVDVPIGRHPVHRKCMAVVPPGSGRPAVTDYEVLNEIGSNSLVQCTLHTGRTHQIRVHMKHLGNPLLGDSVYGASVRGAKFPRPMLHAWKLGFLHPGTGLPIEFEAPIPRDFVEYGAGI